MESLHPIEKARKQISEKLCQNLGDHLAFALPRISSTHRR